MIGDKLPNVAYLTFIDKYILASYIFLISVLVESCFVSDINDENEVLDFNLFYIFSALWVVVMGIAFIGYALWLRRNEEMKLLYSSDDVDDIVNVSWPTLVFDYRHAKRTGHNERILSFMAGVKKGGAHSPVDSAKHDRLRERHDAFLKKQHEEHITAADTETGRYAE